MRVEIKSSEIMYNFNTDYDFQDDSYAFILMPASGKRALQIYLSFSRAVMSAVHMDIDPSERTGFLDSYHALLLLFHR